MSTLDLARAMEVPGRLSFGCTSLSTAFPHGGTEIGLTHEVEVTDDLPRRLLTAEEWGGEVYDAVAGGQNVSLKAVLRAWDDDAVNLWMLNSSAGTVTQHKVIGVPGTNRAGYQWGGRTTVLVFTPESVIGGNDDQHPLVVFHKAMPIQARTVRLPLRLGKKWGLEVEIIGIRDSSDRISKVGFRKDLSL